MRVVILLALVAATVTAAPRSTQRIIGGSATTIDQYPEMVALLYTFLLWSDQTCGGSVLNTRSIITASSCFQDNSPAQFLVRVGSTFSNNGGTVYQASNIIIHPNYTNRLNNDIAIVRTASNIVFNAEVRPASIAGSNFNLADNVSVQAVGWGSTVGRLIGKQLHDVELWTVNADVCKSRYAENGYTVTDNMLCAGWLDVGGLGICGGDGGGPLFYNNTVVGISSWNLQCGSAVYPDVFTRVSSYTTWIEENA